MSDPKSEFFDQHATKWETQCYPETVRVKLAPLVGEFQLKRGSCLLDMGTGTGILHPYLLDAIGESGRVVAFDLSFHMLREARKKPVSPRLLCVQATAIKLLAVSYATI